MKFICPVCQGRCTVPLTEDERKYASPGTMRKECPNCGGQYMYGKGTGLVAARPDGTACEHDYEYKRGPWRCTHEYTCKHCGDRYLLDSGD